ncbi:MAG: hypothetical protein IH873_11115 [Chloroflexi bacterium]|nr:hypothetical protein [Chloroflexota bacterium]
MISKELLDLLVCPKNRMPLTLADEELLARLNQAIAAGKKRFGMILWVNPKVYRRAARALNAK